MAAFDEIFDANHAVSPAALRRLGDQDLKVLRRIALGAQPGANRARAAEAYALARRTEGPQLLGQILGNADEDVALRASAATMLSSVPKGPGEEALLAALAQRPEPLIGSKIAGSLARIGGRSSLEPLGGLAEEGGFAGRRARFAQLVIAHRAGVQGYRPELPKARGLLPVPRRGLAIKVKPAPAGEMREVTATIGADTYGVPLRSARSLGIDCGRDRLVAIIDGRTSPVDLAKKASSKPTLVGVVTERAEVQAVYSTRWVILAGPLEQGRAYVALYRPDGVLALGGEADVSGATASFTLRATRRPGAAPIDVRGELKRGGITFSVAVSAPRATAASAPEPG